MKKGYLSVLGAVSIWAISTGILVKYISVPPFVLYAVGAGFGILFLLINLIINRSIGDLFKYPKKTIFLMSIVGLGIAVNNGLFFIALKSGSVANAVLTHNLAPILVAFIFAPLFLKEKLTIKKLLLIAISFLGLFILTIPNYKQTIDMALIYGLVSAIFYAFHTVMEKKVTQINVDPLSAVVYKNLVPFIIYSPFAISSIVSGISAKNLILLAIWGIFVLGVSFVLFFKGIKQIPATNASLLSYAEPVGAIILAFIFFKEPINLFIITGGLLIVISGILIVKEK